MKLNDRVAIVTGGGKGIGRAISLTFAKEGAVVIVAARDLASIEDTVEEIRSHGGRADAFVTDVRHEDQIKKMVAYTLDKYGRIDILVNNSGTGGPTVNVADLDLDAWNDVMAVNITAPMLCARSAEAHDRCAKRQYYQHQLRRRQVRFPDEKSLRSIETRSYCSDRDTRYRSWGALHPRELHQPRQGEGRTRGECCKG